MIRIKSFMSRTKVNQRGFRLWLEELEISFKIENIKLIYKQYLTHCIEENFYRHVVREHLVAFISKVRY